MDAEARRRRTRLVMTFVFLEVVNIILATAVLSLPLLSVVVGVVGATTLAAAPVYIYLSLHDPRFPRWAIRGPHQ